MLLSDEMKAKGRKSDIPILDTNLQLVTLSFKETDVTLDSNLNCANEVCLSAQNDIFILDSTF
jgi:hypothetical protein